MSLLWMEYEAEFQNLVEAAFRYEEETNPAYFSVLTDRVRKIIHRDTKYNVDFLYTAYMLDDDKVMKDYAAWLYELMYFILNADKHSTDSGMQSNERRLQRPALQGSRAGRRQYM